MPLQGHINSKTIVTIVNCRPELNGKFLLEKTLVAAEHILAAESGEFRLQQFLLTGFVMLKGIA